MVLLTSSQQQLPSPDTRCPTYLNQHNVIVEGAVVVAVVHNESGDIGHLFKSLFDIEVVFAEDHLDQVAPAGGRQVGRTGSERGVGSEVKGQSGAEGSFVLHHKHCPLEAPPGDDHSPPH